ncbi:MAG: acyl-CoA dehydrogenase family protein [Proteobacteria bacterium]|nr:acyl-CoA dehydrogenase family protein [Pseudomonadota bacterium]
MDLSFGPEYEAYRAEVREFTAEWSAHAPLSHERAAEFRDRATERGYLYRGIPKRYGGSEREFDAFREAIVAEEFDASGLPWRLGAQGVGMIVPTLLEIGEEWQREKFIPGTLRGDYVWCQGYSEPGAGSDLASLRSSARLEGDEWVINGHKIWTSDAQDSNYMFGMFRTEPDAPKHAGISYLLLEVDQPGLEIRPLRQIDGAVHFNEVFFDDVRTPADWIVGKRGQGWQVARVNLKYERNLGGGSMMRRHFNGLLELARRSEIDGRPAIQDPVTRRRLAELEGYVRCVETTYMRQLSATANGEEQKVSLPILMNKLYGTDTREKIARLGYDLVGSDGLRAPAEEDLKIQSNTETVTGWVDQYLFSLAGPIAAGSSNIQRNIIGERGLGLPRDLRSPS